MPRFAANLSMLFTEYPFPERFFAAAEAGFDAVEMVNPYLLPPQAIKEISEAAGVEVILFNTPVFDWDEGGRGLAAVPGQEGRFRAGFEMALDYAQTVQPHHIHVMSGNAAGDEARLTLLRNLRWASAIAPEISLTIEPINPQDMPGYFLNDFDQAAAIIAEAGLPNLSLQFDAYHAQRIMEDVQKTWDRVAPMVRHVQVAGVPGRHEPVDGEIDFTAFYARLDTDGYAGVIGAEYHPKGRTEDGLDWLTAR